jgi:hypothetical protein
MPKSGPSGPFCPLLKRLILLTVLGIQWFFFFHVIQHLPRYTMRFHYFHIACPILLFLISLFKFNTCMFNVLYF